jgi:hypothetical protein
VLGVLVEHRRGLPPVDDQEAVEEPTADAADETFCDRVGPRRAHRRPDDADVHRGEDSVDGIGELGVVVPDEEPEATAGVLEGP